MKAKVNRPTVFRKAAVIVSVLFFAALSLGASWQQSGKITICHIPPGNPANRHTIEVSESALQAHLDHGDYIGRCPESNVSTQDDAPDSPNTPINP